MDCTTVEGCTSLQQQQRILWLQTGTVLTGTVNAQLHVWSADISCI